MKVWTHSPKRTETGLQVSTSVRGFPKNRCFQTVPRQACASMVRRITESQLARLETFDFPARSRAWTRSTEMSFSTLRQQVESARRFKYAAGQAGNPYVINQLGGPAYHDLPDFLDSQHGIETKADADAYVARLAAFATAVDQDSGEARHDQSLGVVPPDFVLDSP